MLKYLFMYIYVWSVQMYIYVWSVQDKLSILPHTPNRVQFFSRWRSLFQNPKPTLNYLVSGRRNVSSFFSCLFMSKNWKTLFAFSWGMHFSDKCSDTGFGLFLDFARGRSRRFWRVHWFISREIAAKKILSRIKPHISGWFQGLFGPKVAISPGGKLRDDRCSSISRLRALLFHLTIRFFFLKILWPKKDKQKKYPSRTVCVYSSCILTLINYKGTPNFRSITNQSIENVMSQ